MDTQNNNTATISLLRDYNNAAAFSVTLRTDAH